MFDCCFSCFQFFLGLNFTCNTEMRDEVNFRTTLPTYGQMSIMKGITFKGFLVIGVLTV